MANQIDISLVPLTPKGVNYDFKAVKEYEFVLFDKTVAWKTVSLIGPDSDISDDDQIPTDFTKDNIEDLHDSPMIEFRKKRSTPISEKPKFNPVNIEVLDTSLGWYNNYEKTKRNSIAVMRRLSIVSPKGKSRKTLPARLMDASKENVSPINQDDQNVINPHLELLRTSVSESRPLLRTEHDRLRVSITDWKYILENEDEVPPEAQGRIQSTIGRTQILLNKRFNSTFDVLDKADDFVNNNGIIDEQNEKEYKADDVYGFVDLLINEIKNIDDEFKKLLAMRENNWVEVVESPAARKTVSVKRRPIVNFAKSTKPIKSRLDLKTLRERAKAVVPASIEAGIEFLSVSTVPVAATMDVSVSSEAGSVNGLSRRSIQRTVRSQSEIKSLNGTPVHRDTPRPIRRSMRRTQGQIDDEPGSPIDAPSGKRQRRSKLNDHDDNDADDDDQAKATFLLPMSQPKKARRSKR